MIYLSDRDAFVSKFRPQLRRGVKTCLRKPAIESTPTELHKLAASVVQYLVQHVPGGHWCPSSVWDYLRFCELVFNSDSMAAINRTLKGFYTTVDDGQIIANELIKHRLNWEWLQMNVFGLLESTCRERAARTGRRRPRRRHLRSSPSVSSLASSLRSERTRRNDSIDDTFTLDGVESLYPAIPEVSVLEDICDHENDEHSVLENRYEPSRAGSLVMVRRPSTVYEQEKASQVESTPGRPSRLSRWFSRLFCFASSRLQVVAADDSTLVPSIRSDSLPCKETCFPTAPEVVQINLRGPSLKSAWLSNTEAMSIETPPKDLHGDTTLSTTNVFLAKHALQHTISDFGIESQGTRLDGLHEDLELSPWALRTVIACFFNARMCAISSQPSATADINRPFTLKEEEYCGILVTEYEDPTSTSRTLKSVRFTQDQIEAWGGKVELGLRRPLTDFWGRPDMVVIHQAGDTAPDILVAPERLQTQLAFDRWTAAGLLERPMWRSAFRAQAAQHLEANVVRHYAISFEQLC